MRRDKGSIDSLSAMPVTEPNAAEPAHRRGALCETDRRRDHGESCASKQPKAYVNGDMRDLNETGSQWRGRGRSGGSRRRGISCERRKLEADLLRQELTVNARSLQGRL